MHYIQTIDYNNKKYNFLFTEQEYNSINKNDIYEYRVKDYYLELNNDNFEKIDESKYIELKLYVKFIDFSKLKKRNAPVQFVYYHEVELMHGDADFYLDELFCISKEDYEFIKDGSLTVNFETYDKSDAYGNLMITTSLTHDDFIKIDSRLCHITHNLQDESNYKYRNFELTLPEDLVKNIIDGEDENSQERYDIWIDNYRNMINSHKDEIPKYKGVWLIDDFIDELNISEEELDKHFENYQNFNEQERAEAFKLEKECLDDLYSKYWREINPFAIITARNEERIAIPICKFTKRAIDVLRKAEYFEDKEIDMMLYYSVEESQNVKERIATKEEINEYRKVLIENANKFGKERFEHLKEYIKEISESLTMNYYY